MKRLITLLSALLLILACLPAASAVEYADPAVAKVQFNLRKEMDTNSAILANVPIGAELTVREYPNSEWCKVTYRGKTGYAKTSWLRFRIGQNHVIAKTTTAEAEEETPAAEAAEASATDTADTRRAAATVDESTADAIIPTLQGYNAREIVMDKTGISIGQSDTDEILYIARAATAFNVRSEPSDDGKRIRQISKGGYIRILGYGDDWCKVQTTDGKYTGYAKTKWVFHFHSVDPFLYDVPGYNTIKPTGYVIMKDAVHITDRQNLYKGQNLQPGDYLCVKLTADENYDIVLRRDWITIDGETAEYHPFVPWQEAKAGDIIGGFTVYYGLNQGGPYYIYRRRNINLAMSLMNGTIIRSGGRYSFLTREVDADGRVLSVKYFDVSGNPTTYQNQYAEIRYQYDLAGREVDIRYYDRAGNPVATVRGYARKTTEYNSLGNVTEEAYYDTEDNLTDTAMGYAVARFTYDEMGNLVSEKYLDTQLLGIVPEDARYASVYNAWDEEGRLISEEYVDELDAPVNNREGFATHTISYTESGLIAEETYRDENDEPALTSEGYSHRTLVEEDQDSRTYVMRQENELLAEEAGRVIAVEIDKRLIPILKQNLAAYTNVDIVQGDFLKLDLPAFFAEKGIDRPVKVVANLPYYITTPIIMALFESGIALDSITVMVQEEVARRMQAGPGTKDYGALSLAGQYYAQCYIAAYVPQNCFMPRPGVGSAVIRLTRFSEPPVKVQDEKLLFGLIRAAFAQRRKTLINSVSNSQELALTKEEMLGALQTMGLSETIRGEALTKDFVDTAKSLGCCRVAPLMRDKKGRVTDKEIVDYAHDNGMKVTGWMVQDLEAWKTAKAAGCDCTTSDYPMALLKAIKADGAK